MSPFADFARYSPSFSELFDLFTRTRAIRRSIIQAGQDTEMVDFGRHAMDQK